jgi:hypothetical protein
VIVIDVIPTNRYVGVTISSLVLVCQSNSVADFVDDSAERRIRSQIYFLTPAADAEKAAFISKFAGT